MTGARLGPRHLPSKRNFRVEKLQLSPFTSHRLPVNQGGQSCVLRGSLSQGPGIASSLLTVLTLAGGCSFRLQPEIWNTNKTLLEILPWHWLTTGQKERTVSGILVCFGSPGGRCQAAASLLCNEHLHFPISTVGEFNNTNSKLCEESS